MDAGAFGRGAILAYGALGLPLAFAALPLYVHVPRLYAGEVGLSLATVGAVLLAARIVDAVTDPLIGWASDRIRGRRGLLLVACLLLGLSLPALLSPPADAGVGWLFGFIVLVSLAYSVASIAYSAWGAEVAPTPDLRTRFVAAREGFALLGVVLAAALPAVLAQGAGEAAGLARLSWIFLPLLLACAAWTLLGAPAAPVHAGRGQSVWGGLAGALRDGAFVRLLAVFAVNGIAAAVPSATVLFFVADVLQADDRAAGAFLVLYFAAAAASLPLWVALSRHLGKLRAWLAGMVLAVAVFVWAGLLGSGDLLAYGAICVLSGVALGADLSLPPSLLADLLARSQEMGAGGAEARGGGVRAGACFGWWNFVTKANLALAAGLALPLLAALGYAPGARDADATAALAMVYAGLPVVLKLGAVVLLWRWRGQIEPVAAATDSAAAAALREVRS
ncbi:MAG: MFS transporter [Thauera sp.]|nr:MFS transporter [Thauera sp.]